MEKINKLIAERNKASALNAIEKSDGFILFTVNKVEDMDIGKIIVNATKDHLEFFIEDGLERLLSELRSGLIKDKND